MKMIGRFVGISLVLVSALLAEQENSNLEAAKKKAAYLGVHVTAVTPVLTTQLGLEEGVGLVVDFVDEGSPAAEAGLKKFDILLKLEDQILIGNRQFSTLIRNRDVGSQVAIAYLRSGEKTSAVVELGERAESPIETMNWVGHGDFEMPGQRVFKFHGLDHLSRVDPEAMAEWSERLGKNVETVIENVYKSSGHPGLEKMPRVYLKRGGKMMRFSDGEVSYSYSRGDGEPILQILDSKGVNLFKGSVHSEEDLKTIPVEFRDRARMMLMIEKRLEDKQAEL